MTKAELAKHPRRAVTQVQRWGSAYVLKMRCGHTLTHRTLSIGPAIGTMIRCPECVPEGQA